MNSKKNYPVRKPTRLKEFDYSNNGYYFITICVQNNKMIFGDVENEKMKLNTYGKEVEKILLSLPERYKQIEIDYYVIMPNHFHGIFILSNENNQSVTISNVIGGFKSLTTITIHKLGIKDFKWQRSFYDRIIRDEKELFYIRQYIEQNPLRWEIEKNNPNNLDL
ncbi:transposase [Ignavibacterium sp.]|uniref:transposase n=1 Tax=Ignavibacterium sp. TaxID=2651167 RepID=UPI00307E8204